MALVSGFEGNFRSIRDQLIRASQSIPLNIAEGNGKRSLNERRRYLEIARGSAMESAASLDVLVAIGACAPTQITKGKGLLVRIVSMLSRMTEPSNDRVREDSDPYTPWDSKSVDYEHDYEHEHGNRE